MDNYVDLIIRADPDITTPTLLGNLYGRVHLALVSQGCGEVGVSFPNHENHVGLGNVLRLHGSQSRLSTMLDAIQLGGLRVHLDIQGPLPIPAQVNQYRVVKRVQAKSNPERLRRRLVKRQGISPEEARNRIPDTAKRTLDLPYVNLVSASTGQHFPLFVKHEDCRSLPQQGAFNTYGFSSRATIPWF
ncbi:MAG TPA: type I-F CRISPR-associated endoribonuclease Cas6/Csy4 [Porticoccaceae bacterium]|nr:type I-F CRISPR-associated endoribonuclease Cas6/Csy4 [Porticoccaceae bacterium]